MLKISIIIFSLLLLFGCGSQSSDEETVIATDKNIIGSWEVSYEQDTCIETMIFQDDNTFTYTTPYSYTYGKYTTAIEDGFTKLSMYFLSSEEILDCENVRWDPSNKLVKIYLDYTTDNLMHWYQATTSVVSLVSWKRITLVSDAGADINTTINNSVVVSASKSYSIYDSPLEYLWIFEQKPLDSNATLINANEQNASFTPDMQGKYIAKLTLSNADNQSTTDTITIWVSNNLPIADAGEDQKVRIDKEVQLDGSRSKDPSSKLLTYLWSIKTKPENSLATISDDSAISPIFYPDILGEYTLGLVVDNGDRNSTEDSVKISVERNIDLLNFLIIDAEYSDSLDKIIMVSSSPNNQLQIYNPDAKTNISIDLPLSPNCISVSPDGLYAAVGHNTYVSYVDLARAQLIKTIAVSTDVLDVVLAGNGYIYAFPREDQWETIRTINIDTQEESVSSHNIYAGTLAKLHPDGDYIYGANNGISPSDIEKYDIQNGTARYLYDSPYHGDYSMCGDLWFSEDGLRIYTKCANVFRSSTTESEDIHYNSSFTDIDYIRSLDHSLSAGKIVVIPENNYGSNENVESSIKIYEDTFLNFKEELSLASFYINNNRYIAYGRYIFYKSDGSLFYVIVQSDSSSNMLYDYGVITY